MAPKGRLRGLDSSSALAFLCAAGTVAAFCLPIANPDIFWHLSAARWIAENLALPRVDWLSQTMGGQPWSDFEWLTQLIWYGIFKGAGMKGLWLLKVLLYCACGATLWRALRLYKTGVVAASLAVSVITCPFA